MATEENNHCLGAKEPPGQGSAIASDQLVEQVAKC